MVANQPRAETREVHCAHCNREIEIPVRAMSVNCRHCHRRVVVEDMVIKAYHAVLRLATAGKVEVAKNATVIAEVHVRELDVKGSVKGDVVAIERVSVGRKGVLEGNVSCRRIVVQPGAQLSGYYVVTPEFSPPKEPLGDAD